MQLDYGTESLKREHDFTFTVRIQFWRLVTVNTLNIADWKKRNRNSRPEVFCKKSVLRNFTKFTGKQLCQSLFLKKKRPWPATLLKKRLWHRCFAVNIVKFLRTPFFIERLYWLLRKKERQRKAFSIYY